ncbi:hypothetical protein QJS66_13640 [Kocuria rhizophila]|nr:hypothetical protein QJS66_13640 [Kocuria rhizophila]
MAWLRLRRRPPSPPRSHPASSRTGKISRHKIPATCTWWTSSHDRDRQGPQGGRCARRR